MESIDFPEEEIGWSDLEEGEWTSWPDQIELPPLDQEDWSEYEFSLEREIDSYPLSSGFRDEDYTPSDTPVEEGVEDVNSEDWPWPVDEESPNNTAEEEKETDSEPREPIDITNLSIGEYTEEDMSRCSRECSWEGTISILRQANARIQELREQEEAELRELESKKLKR